MVLVILDSQSEYVQDVSLVLLHFKLVSLDYLLKHLKKGVSQLAIHH